MCSTFEKSINIAERITGIETWSISKEPTFPILLKAPLSQSDMLTLDNQIDEKSSSSSKAPLSIFAILHFKNVNALLGNPRPIRYNARCRMVPIAVSIKIDRSQIGKIVESVGGNVGYITPRY